MNMINYWTYNGIHLDKLDEGIVGFVYIIYYDNGCRYIGKKQTSTIKTLPALQNGKIREGATRVNRVVPLTTAEVKALPKGRRFQKGKLAPYDQIVTEKKWKDYVGSSKDIPDEARIQSKVILHLCTNKRTMTYLEEKEMFLRNVLLDKWYYNKSIAGRYYDNCEDGLYIPPTESHTQLIMEM